MLGLLALNKYYICIKLLNPYYMIKQIYRFLNPKFQNLFLDYKVEFKPRYGHGLPPHSELYSIINNNRGV